MRNNNRTLIILSPGFPKDEADTACLPFLQTFVRSLNKVDPSLKIIVLAFQYPFFVKEYVWENATVIAFNGRNRKKPFKLFLWLRILARVKTLFRRNNVIGIFNLWFGECALVGKWIAKKYRVRSLTWILGQDAKENNKHFRKIKPKPEDLIAMSDFLADHFQKNFKVRPQHVIPLGVDKTLFTDPLPERSIDILGAGSLIPLKQYDVFIRVVTQLAKLQPGIRVVILGEGKERENLQRMIDEHQMTNNIKLGGEISHKETLLMMQRSKIFLHTSAYEGFGTVCAEALYAGCKLVSFVKPMKRAFKNWFIVKTEEEMIFQLEILLEDANAKYERVMVYDSEEIGKEILSLYRSF